MSETTLIKDCTIVNEGVVKESDLLIKNGRIEKIASGLSTDGITIDGSGLHLLPGVIDDQVHFREPCLEGFLLLL